MVEIVDNQYEDSDPISPVADLHHFSTNQHSSHQLILFTVFSPSALKVNNSLAVVAVS